jgi:hypothetical protein
VQITSYFPARPVSDLYGRNKYHFAQHYTANEKFNNFVMTYIRIVYLLFRASSVYFILFNNQRDTALSIRLCF